MSPSYTAGLAANLPGGIGVFDTAMLFGLEPYVSAPHIVGAIVVFRLYYYIIPLFLAGFLFAGNEILLRGGVLLRGWSGSARCRRWRAGASRTSPSPAPPALVALCGAMLLCLGVLAPQPDFSWMDPDFAEIAYQAGQFIPSLIGAGLIVMAIGLSHRVNLAWGADDLAAGRGRGFHRAAGQRLWVAARAGGDRRAAGAVPRLLLPPRQPAQRTVGAVDRDVRCSCWSSACWRWRSPARAFTAEQQCLVGGGDVARSAEFGAR